MFGIEKDEIIKEQNGVNDKVQYFREMITDLEDEILLKDIKISNLGVILFEERKRV